MKRKGFTLIELIVYLAIAAIISSVAITAISAVKNFKIEYTNKICQKEIALLIHRARMYCYAKGSDGHIILDINNNRIMFVYKTKMIDEVRLNGKMLQHSTNIDKIFIDSHGNLDKRGTISFLDEKNKRINITIHVASEYIDEK